MRVKDATLKFIRDTITGDGQISPYKSGPLLVEFFNKFGFSDTYGRGFPSRWQFAQERLEILNEEGRIDEVLKYYLDPINWVDKEAELDTIVKKLNKYLKHDGYKVIIDEDRGVLIVDIKKTLATPKVPKQLTQESINEWLDKCSNRINSGDYSGAITAARSLLETFLLSVYSQIKGEEYKFNGDLPKLFKEVLKILGYTVTPDLPGSTKKILNGLHTTVNGISELSNELGDRHGKSDFKEVPKEYAELFVNATVVIINFIAVLSEKIQKNASSE